MLASKVAGPVRDPKRPGHIRDGKTFLDRKNLTAALDASLKRLRTDYLDLYQLHWPDRTTATFGKLAYPGPRASRPWPSRKRCPCCRTSCARARCAMWACQRNALGRGAVPQARREPGAAAHRVHQNAYSLLNRVFESGLSEFSRHEDVGLLAYSPLAMGMLCGKYLDGARPRARA